MKVPDSQIRIRVDEVFRQIENNFNAWRDGATTGSLSAVKGFIGNRIQRVSNQSSPTLAATVAQSAKTLIFSAISKAHIPGVSHLADGVSLLIDSATKLGELLTAKGIEHEQKKYLLAASLSDQPDSQEIKKQGEYFALDGAQKVVDAIRKAQKALTDTYDAYNRMYIPDINLADCGTFVDFLTRAHYLYYRVDRLQYYNSRLQRWAAMVEAQLKDLQKECEDMKGDTYDVAEEIVHNAITDDDWQKHDKLCNRKPCCLFTPQWLNEYWRSPSLISEQTTPPPTQGPLRQGPPGNQDQMSWN